MSSRFYDMSYPQYTVHDVSALTGLTPQTIRYYDSIGVVVPQRGAQGQRLYSYYDVAQRRADVHRVDQGEQLLRVAAQANALRRDHAAARRTAGGKTRRYRGKAARAPARAAQS